MSKTISGAGNHGSVADTDRVPASKGPFTPGSAGYHALSAIKAYVLNALAGSSVGNTPAGNITATNVQDAIDELDTEKVAKSGGTMTGPLDIVVAGGGADLLRVWGDGTTQVSVRRAQANNAPPAVAMQKARGDLSALAAVAQNDRMFVLIGAAYDGSAFRESNYIFADVVAATPGPSDMESRWQFFATPAASGTPSEIMRLRHSTGLSMYGDNAVISPNRLFRNRVYTVATLPTANIANGDQAMVSNANAPVTGNVVAGGGAVRCLVVYDGTAWRVA